VLSRRETRRRSGTPRLAIAHDWLNQAGGAEVVLSELHDMYPTAPIYTAMADHRRRPEIAAWPIQSTNLDRLPAIHRRHQWYLPAYPLVWARTRVENADVVVSNKSAFCFGLDAGQAVHVCYCLTPTRFVWDVDHYMAHERLPRGSRLAMAGLLPWLRRWERDAARRVDHFLAISSVVQERISAAYGRRSEVVFPPVDTGAYEPGEPGDFHLVLARLVPYKRIDLAVRAFNQLGMRLIVAGEGRDFERLRGMAGPSVEFVGRVDAHEAKRLLGQCQGLIWPGIEDFGLVPIEAMASGRPVIARRGGGVVDTVVEGETGVFFDDASPESLARAVIEAAGIKWRTKAIRSHATGFDRAVFRQRMSDIVEMAWAVRQARSQIPLPSAAARHNSTGAAASTATRAKGTNGRRPGTARATPTGSRT
jgi:glycosyltransferase involved in cell wall biosynthesis